MKIFSEKNRNFVCGRDFLTVGDDGISALGGVAVPEALPRKIVIFTNKIQRMYNDEIVLT